MQRLIRTLFVLTLVLPGLALHAGEMQVTYKGKTFTTTTDIPHEYFGTYLDEYKRVDLVISIRKDGSCTLDGTPCRWGVHTENGKIVTRRLKLPNPEYEPVDEMVIFFVADATGEVTATQLFTARSAKWGTFQTMPPLRKQ